jgi:hypothetical protein
MGTVEYEFAEFDAPRRFMHRTRVLFGEMNHRLTFEAAPEGSRLTQEGWLEPNLLGRLIAPIANRMLSRRLPIVAHELQRAGAGHLLRSRGEASSEISLPRPTRGLHDDLAGWPRRQEGRSILSVGEDSGWTSTPTT